MVRQGKPNVPISEDQALANARPLGGVQEVKPAERRISPNARLIREGAPPLWQELAALVDAGEATGASDLSGSSTRV